MNFKSSYRWGEREKTSKLRLGGEHLFTIAERGLDHKFLESSELSKLALEIREKEDRRPL